MRAALLRLVARWRSTQLKEAFSRPPTNQFQNGGLLVSSVVCQYASHVGAVPLQPATSILPLASSTLNSAEPAQCGRGVSDDPLSTSGGTACRRLLKPFVMALDARLELVFASTEQRVADALGGSRQHRNRAPQPWGESSPVAVLPVGSRPVVSSRPGAALRNVACAR